MKLVGAHVSSAGGCWKVFSNAEEINAKSASFFLGNQRRWGLKTLDDETVRKFREQLTKSRILIEHIMPHGSYLINLGDPDIEKRRRGFQLFLDEMKLCELLGLQLYNIHPGSSLGKCAQLDSIQLIAESINEAHKLTHNVIVVLETTAGQGNSIGSSFSELRNIIDLIHDPHRIGVCLDTCHVFAAGYDIRTKAAYEKTLEDFETTIGWKYLRAVHLNDSNCPLGEKKDRHENIGKGHIGYNAFRWIMKDPRFNDMPLILETPTGSNEETYRNEIELLNGFEKETS